MDNSAQSRIAKLLLNGCVVSLKNESESTGKVLLDSVDSEVDIEICGTFSKLRCSLSALVCRLSYVDYLSLKCIVQDNFGGENNRHQWDNLETACEEELSKKDTTDDESLINSTEIVYSSSARVIRYGHSKNSRAKLASIHASICCGSLGLILRRDDNVNPDSSYDMIALRGEGIECEFGRKEEGELWLNLTLSQMFAFDLGRIGRQVRSNRACTNGTLATDALSVLVEGYSSSSVDISDVDSQLVVKLERDPADSGTVNLVVIVSFISITALLEPIQDVLNFLTCRWELDFIREIAKNKSMSNGEASSGDEEHTTRLFFLSSFRSKICVRFVSHYARFIFSANEHDIHSRYLILKGYVNWQICYTCYTCKYLIRSLQPFNRKCFMFTRR
jgi:hypothetical protein